jgi:hypothetical protein
MEGLRFYLSKIGHPITSDINVIENRKLDPDFLPFEKDL